MALQDDLWAMQRMMSHKDLTECSSFRVEVDGAVHRVVRLKTQSNTRPWWALCGFSPNFLTMSALHDDRQVDCLGCLAEGG